MIHSNRLTSALAVTGAALSFGAVAVTTAQAATMDRFDTGSTASISLSDAKSEKNSIVLQLLGNRKVLVNDYGAQGALTASAAQFCTLTGGGQTFTCTVADTLTSLKLALNGNNGDDRIGTTKSVIVSGVSLAISGGAGADTVDSEMAATIAGGGDDDIVVDRDGKDTIDGGSGTDLVKFDDRVVPVSVDLASGAAAQGRAGEGDRIIGVEDVYGGAAADKLSGSSADNVLIGGGGGDAVDARGGADTVDTRDGVKDTVACGTGDDTVYADYKDAVAADCENVLRSGLKPGPGDVAPQPNPGDPQPQPQPEPQPGPGDQPNEPQPADVTKPVLSGLGFAPSRFRVAPTTKAISAGKRRGSMLGFTLSEAAAVTVRIERLLPGRRSGTACVRPTAKLKARHAKRCTRSRKVVSRTYAGAIAGKSAIAFTGKAHGKALTRGTYRAVARATDAAKNTSASRSARFRITR